MSVKVLIADSDPIAGRVLETSLRRAGFDVARESNGAVALEKLRREPHQALVTSWRLPGIDGIELVEQVRDELESPRVILVSTVQASAGAKARAEEAGANAILAKPAPADEVIDLLRSFWSRSSDHVRATVPAGQ